MIMVSHDKGFTDQLENIHVIDLGKILK
jgi:hypothetical protein